MTKRKLKRKHIKRNKKNREINLFWKARCKNKIKEIKLLLKSDEIKKATELQNKSFKYIDKAVKKNVYHMNNGARKKSQISKMINIINQNSKAKN